MFNKGGRVKFNKGDRVKIVSGAFAGETGTVVKHYIIMLEEYYPVDVELDKGPRGITPFSTDELELI